MHIMRNAVDHGIETPEERGKGRKKPRGLAIRLAVESHGGELIARISDDGRGMDRKAPAESPGEAPVYQARGAAHHRRNFCRTSAPARPSLTRRPTHTLAGA